MISHGAEFFKHGVRWLRSGIAIACGPAERLRGLVKKGAIVGVRVEGERATIRLLDLRA